MLQLNNIAWPAKLVLEYRQHGPFSRKDKLRVTDNLKIYMAGPDVFLPIALEVAVAKKALLERHGFTGLHPFDNEIEFGKHSPEETSRLIKVANCDMMRGADAILANLTPFQSCNADAGTAYEVGFMDALGKPAFGYMNVERTFAERVADFNGHPLRDNGDGYLRDRFGMAVENFGLMNNLMLEWAVRSFSSRNIAVAETTEDDRYSSLIAFEHAVRMMAEFFAQSQPIR